MPSMRLECLSRRLSVVAFAAALAVPSLMGGDAALFPKAVHFVRQVDDPITHSVRKVDEYCAGNRIVSVNGEKVAITDYDTQQVTEIDHKAGTWSVTRFDEIAKAQASVAAPAVAAKASNASTAPAWKTTSIGTKPARTGRALDTYVIEHADARGSQHIEVGVDRSVTLSRQAVEVLIGAAYPSIHRAEHDEILGAASGVVRTGKAVPDNAGTVYALPVEQTVTVEADGQTLTLHNSVIQVGDEAAPSAAMLIEPGARRVESRLTRLARELHDVETLPSRNPQH